MPSQTYNLDDSVNESFKFIANGHTYIFRHLNTEEIDAMRKVSEDEGKFKEFIAQFITKENESSPDFIDIFKKMITPQWRNFNKMIKAEFDIR